MRTIAIQLYLFSKGDRVDYGGVSATVVEDQEVLGGPIPEPVSLHYLNIVLPNVKIHLDEPTSSHPVAGGATIDADPALLMRIEKGIVKS